MNKEIESINVGDITVRPDKNLFIAGPCAVESDEQILEIAHNVVADGADILRGGVFKPRTNPKDFQGLGQKGAEFLFNAGRENNVPVVTEVMSESQIPVTINAAKGHPFMWQIGSRNAQNYDLLKAVGQTGIPVLLKRGKGSSIKEMLGAAKYISAGGSPVLMCERGIVSFNSGNPSVDAGRFTPDHLAVLRFQEEGFMTIFDPSHAAGRADHVVPLALSGIAIGANGIIVEVHNSPCDALCDKDQAITFDQFRELIKKANRTNTKKWGTQNE